jgi:hypothetical protein
MVPPARQVKGPGNENIWVLVSMREDVSVPCPLRKQETRLPFGENGA